MKEPKRIRAMFTTEVQASGRIIMRPDESTRAQRKPYLSGGGEVSHVCKLCGYPLTRFVSEEQVRDMVFECPSCESLNAITA